MYIYACRKMENVIESILWRSFHPGYLQVDYKPKKQQQQFIGYFQQTYMYILTSTQTYIYIYIYQLIVM